MAFTEGDRVEDSAGAGEVVRVSTTYNMDRSNKQLDRDEPLVLVRYDDGSTRWGPAHRWKGTK